MFRLSREGRRQLIDGDHSGSFAIGDIFGPRLVGRDPKPGAFAFPPHVSDVGGRDALFGVVRSKCGAVRPDTGRPWCKKDGEQHPDVCAVPDWQRHYRNDPYCHETYGGSAQNEPGSAVAHEGYREPMERRANQHCQPEEDCPERHKAGEKDEQLDQDSATGSTGAGVSAGAISASFSVSVSMSSRRALSIVLTSRLATDFPSSATIPPIGSRP